MKSLEERKAYRLKQKEANKQAAVESGDAVEGSAEFDAADWLADSVPNIEAAIGELTDEQLDLIEASEKEVKDRVGVHSAIAAERTKRASTATGWNGSQA